MSKMRRQIAKSSTTSRLATCQLIYHASNSTVPLTGTLTRSANLINLLYFSKPNVTYCLLQHHNHAPVGQLSIDS